MINFQKTTRANARSATDANHLYIFVDENGILCGKTNTGTVISLHGTNGTNGTNGAAGRGISGVALTNTSGANKTYTITYTDATTSTFTVTDGATGAQGPSGAAGATGPAGEDGRGIVSVALTSTVGRTKTYTITFTDATTVTFDVVDGADGAGGGGSASVPTTIPITGGTGRTLETGDLNNIIVMNSSSISTFTIPQDSALGGLGPTVGATIELFQKGAGRVDIVAGAGVTLRKWSGYPTPAQYVSQSIVHIGANEWAVR